MDAIDHDAALIGLDEDCWVDPRDRFLFPDGPPERPRSWPEGWGRSPGRPVWMVQSHTGTPDEVLDRLRRVLADVATMRLPTQSRRSVPLLALPVLPVPQHAGTPAPEVHTWLTLLLETLHTRAREDGMDVVLLAQDPGEYAAAQWIRRLWETDLPEHLEQHATELGVRASRGGLSFFLGTALEHPPHDALVRELAQESAGLDPDETSGLTTAEVTALLEAHNPDGVREALIRRATGVGRPGLTHALIAATGCQEFVTTAHHTLLERAVTEVHDDVPAVLPWSPDSGAPVWVAKTRGDVTHPREISLRAPDDDHPVAALFRGLTLTRHLVVVGSHLDEPELVRSLRRPGDRVPGTRCGTLLDLAPAGRHALAPLWGDRLARVELDQNPETPNAERMLMLFLDRLGVHATRPERWLLDERFAGLLAPRDQVLSAQVRAVLGLLPPDAPTWTPLRHSAEDLGWLSH